MEIEGVGEKLASPPQTDPAVGQPRFIKAKQFENPAFDCLEIITKNALYVGFPPPPPPNILLRYNIILLCNTFYLQIIIYSHITFIGTSDARIYISQV